MHNSPLTGTPVPDISDPNDVPGDLMRVVNHLEQFVTVICTSGTRPSQPVKGMRIYETDTGEELVWYGATSGWLPPWARPWGGSAPWGKSGSGTSGKRVPAYPGNIIAASLSQVTFRRGRQYEVKAQSSYWMPPGNAGHVFAMLNVGHGSLAGGGAVVSNDVTGFPITLTNIVNYTPAQTETRDIALWAQYWGGGYSIMADSMPWTITVQDVGKAGAPPAA